SIGSPALSLVETDRTGRLPAFRGNRAVRPDLRLRARTLRGSCPDVGLESSCRSDDAQHRDVATAKPASGYGESGWSHRDQSPDAGGPPGRHFELLTLQRSSFPR